ncbi:MAG: FAD-dependent oxidoreductase [Shinella sp.]|nr:FAD-dependent oxidoreductase [Shinella sp.]
MTARILSDAGSIAATYDLAVIGAGPAGLAAAAEASRLGARVLAIDENAAPGGQIYRSVTRNSPRDLPVLGQDYWNGQALADSFLTSDLDYAPGGTVWSLEPATAGDDGRGIRARIGISLNGAACLIDAKAVIIATGAMERPMPVPGWTLPGVMTAGAAQIALKSAAIVPAGRVVLAGCGPLIYLLAAQLLDAGAEIAALLDTTDRRRYPAAVRHLPDFLRSPYFRKGLSLLLKVRRSVPVVSGITALRILGDRKAETIEFHTGHRKRTVAADCVLLHQGIVPNINLASAAGCAIEWNERQRAFQPATDTEGGSSLPGIFVAGDGGGIGGAQHAEVCGRIAAFAALRTIGLAVPETALAALREERRRFAKGRAFLDTLYRPAEAFRAPPDPDTIVCRCEEVRAGTLRGIVALGVPGPNQLKTFVRCGMGPCQGRMCALTVSEIMAAERGTSPAEIGTYRLRAPVKPLRLSEMAAMPPSPSAVLAVTGRSPDEGP